jgi:hypothetical protein
MSNVAQNSKQLAIGLLVFVALLASESRADECKFDRIEIDTFTKEKTVHTQKRMLTDRANGFVGRVFGGDASEVLMRGISEGGDRYIGVEVRLLKTYGTPIDTQDLREALLVKEGAKLMILMDDDSIVKLSADQDYRGKASVDVDADGNYAVDAEVTALYRLTDESAEALTSREAMVVRVAVDSGNLGLSGREANINFGTNSKSKSFFKDAIICLEQGAQLESK